MGGCCAYYETIDYRFISLSMTKFISSGLYKNKNIDHAYGVINADYSGQNL